MQYFWDFKDKHLFRIEKVCSDVPFLTSASNLKLTAPIEFASKRRVVDQYEYTITSNEKVFDVYLPETVVCQVKEEVEFTEVQMLQKQVITIHTSNVMCGDLVYNTFVDGKLEKNSTGLYCNANDVVTIILVEVAWTFLPELLVEIDSFNKYTIKRHVKCTFVESVPSGDRRLYRTLGEGEAWVKCNLKEGKCTMTVDCVTPVSIVLLKYTGLNKINVPECVSADNVQYLRFCITTPAVFAVNCAPEAL